MKEEKTENRRWFSYVVWIVIIIILIVMIILQVSKPQETQSESQDEGVLGGFADSTPQTLENEEAQEAKTVTAPDFSLQDLNGEMVSLSDFKGTPVLLNFWATWCPPCVQEMPLLQEVADQYAGELVVLALNGGDTMDEIRSFAIANNYTLTFLADPENNSAVEYQVKGFPTSFFIDADGQIQGTYIGMMEENIIAYYLAKIGITE